MNLSKSVAELQREHVVLELECIDRMYLNAYVPQLTSEAGVAGFVRGYLGHRFASTKQVAQMTEAFVESIMQFGLDHKIDPSLSNCSNRLTLRANVSRRCVLVTQGFRPSLPYC